MTAKQVRKMIGIILSIIGALLSAKGGYDLVQAKQALSALVAGQVYGFGSSDTSKTMNICLNDNYQKISFKRIIHLSIILKLSENKSHFN